MILILVIFRVRGLPRYLGNAQQFPGEYEGCPLEESSFPYLVDSAELLRYPYLRDALTRP